MQVDPLDPKAKADSAEAPLLLPAPPSYPLLGPPPRNSPAPDLPLSDAVTLWTGWLLAAAHIDVGDHVRRCVSALNARLTSPNGNRTYFAYPTESLERVQRQLAQQGRSPANVDEGQAWRTLSRAFAQAIQMRGVLG
ncbi:MAG: hypothetical protein H7338_06710 [Candidatus Sericytochromatia bacterium]|nr:hypothetical protein [Candidatus Sericytochromatia bacterium]